MRSQPPSLPRLLTFTGKESHGQPLIRSPSEGQEYFVVQRISSTAHQGHGGGKDNDCQSGKRGRYMRSTRLKQAGIRFKIRTNFDLTVIPVRKSLGP
jgi:hypothetical protein